MSNYKIRQINSGDVWMDVAIIGSGSRALVLIPGVSTKPTTPNAGLVAAAFGIFSQDYTIYMFDRRSGITDPDYSIQDMAEDQYRILQQMDVEKADFMGCSQGGMIVQCIALQHSEICRKLVLAGTSCRVNPLSEQVFRQWKSLALSGLIDRLGQQMNGDVYAPETIRNFGDLLSGYYEGTTEEQLRQFVIMVDSMLKFDIRKDLHHIQNETLVAGCEGDRVLSAEASREMAEILGCKSYIYDSTYGHAFYDEAPDFRQRVLDFLNEGVQV